MGSIVQKPALVTEGQDLHFEPCVGGYLIWDGIHHIGNLSTNHHQGLFRNGGAIHESLPRKAWSIHWTSPYIRVEVMKAVLEKIPENPLPFQESTPG